MSDRPIQAKNPKGWVLTAGLGLAVGVLSGFLGLTTLHVPPMVLYAVMPYCTVAASLLPPIRKLWHRAAIVAGPLACTLVLFLYARDTRTPISGAIETWIVFGIPLFALVPALVGLLAARRTESSPGH